MRKIDTAVELLKWPTALFTLFMLPGAILTVAPVARQIWANLGSQIPFLGGFAAYFIAWYFLLRRPLLGSAFSTLEHELTHALFALLTGHKVKGIKISWSSGGQMTSVGGYNWLIFSAPYFFPTFSALIMVLLIVLPLGSTTRALFGATTAYHLLSTMRETHLGQTDLTRVGYLFSLSFLPAVNIMVYTSLFAFSAGGWGSFSRYYSASLHASLALFGLS